jgi:hypothetical protein
MESPKDELIELQYRRIEAILQLYDSATLKIEKLQKQLNYEKRKN